MPIGVGTAIAIGSGIYGGGKALGLWGQPPKKTYKQSPEEKAYFDLLGKRSREGAYGTGVLFNRQNRATSTASNTARNLEISREGRALARGTQGVSSRESQKVADRQLIDILARSATEGQDLNELSKIKAQDRLGGLGLDKSARDTEMAHYNAMERYGARQQGMQTFMSSLGGIASSLDAKQISSIGDIVSKDSNLWTAQETATMQELFLTDENALINFYQMGGRMPRMQSFNVGSFNNAYSGLGLNSGFTLPKPD